MPLADGGSGTPLPSPSDGGPDSRPRDRPGASATLANNQRRERSTAGC